MHNVSNMLLTYLKNRQIWRLYGNLDHSLPGIQAALQQRDDVPTFIELPDRRTAALMAVAHAHYTREVGVWLTSTSTQSFELLAELKECTLHRLSIVAILGYPSVQNSGNGNGKSSEKQLRTWLRSNTDITTYVLNDPEQTHSMVAQALDMAQAERSITCLIVPEEIQQQMSQTLPAYHSILPAVPEDVPNQGNVSMGAACRHRHRP